MGASQSSIKSQTEILNEVAVNVMNKNSSTSSSAIAQTNNVLLAGNVNSEFKGIEQINSASINVSSLLESSANGELQSELISTISETIQKESSAFGYSGNKAEVDSVVSNAINSNITNETLQEIKNTVEQTNEVKILVNQGVEATEIVQKNEAELIAKMINTTNTEIIAQLQSDGTIKKDISMKSQQFGFGFGSFGLIAGIFIIFIIAGGAFFLYGSDKVLNLIMNKWVIGGVIVLVIFLVLLFTIFDDSSEEGFYGEMLDGSSF